MRTAAKIISGILWLAPAAPAGLTPLDPAPAQNLPADRPPDLGGMSAFLDGIQDLAFTERAAEPQADLRAFGQPQIGTTSSTRPSSGVSGGARQAGQSPPRRTAFDVLSELAAATVAPHAHGLPAGSGDDDRGPDARLTTVAVPLPPSVVGAVVLGAGAVGRLILGPSRRRRRATPFR